MNFETVLQKKIAMKMKKKFCNEKTCNKKISLFTHFFL